MTSTMTVTIHTIGPDDWQLLRDVRLRALADAPAAFGSRFEEQRLYPDSFWQEAASWRPPLGQAFAALEDGRAIGLVRVHCDPATPTEAQLISMWVEPAARGAGVGRALVEQVVAWATEQGVACVYLWVTEPNRPALRLYESCGFAATGAREPFEPDPSVAQIALRRPL